MANIPLVEVGTGNQIKVVEPVYLTGIDPDGNVKGVSVNADGSIAMSGPTGSTGAPVVPSNITTKFREAFQTYPNVAKWSENKAAGDIVQIDGNIAGASYLVASLSPLNTGTTTIVDSVATFSMPLDVSIGLHTSQRVAGQELAIEVVSTETPDVIPADVAISAIQQVTTVLSITTTTAHGLKPGDRFSVYGVTDSRFNYPALVVASANTTTTLTATAGPAGTIASVTAGPYAMGFVALRPACSKIPNATSMILENSTVTNASFYTKSEGGDVMPIGGTLLGNHAVTVGTTVSIQAANAIAAYSFRPTNEYRLYLMADRLQWIDNLVDTTAASSARATNTQVVPNSALLYKLRIRATNLKSLTTPIAEILTVSKSGSTTATVTTATPHGLNALDFIQTYGVRDQTSFPNVTTPTVVASIVNSTQFTIVTGASLTISSFGGFVSRVNGSLSQAGVVTMAVQSVARTSNVLTVVGSASWSGLLVGDYINLVGVRNSTDGATVGVDGSYRIREITTTNLILEPIDGAPLGADIVTTNCGGGVIRRTDLRISYARIFDFERERVELLIRPQADVAAAIPVAISGTPAVTLSGTANSIQGGAAHSAARAGNPLPIGGKVVTTIDTTLANADTTDAFFDRNGSLATIPYTVSDLHRYNVPPAGGNIVNTASPVTLYAAPGASTRMFIAGLQLSSDALSAACDLVIRDAALTASSQTISANTLTTSTAHGLAVGDAIVASASTVTGLTAGTTYYVLTVPAATTLTFSATSGGSTLTISGTGVTATLNHIIWRTRLQTAGVPQVNNIEFNLPLKAGTAVAVEAITSAAVTGGIYLTTQAYIGV
jgi:hypothetical protein